MCFIGPFVKIANTIQGKALICNSVTTEKKGQTNLELKRLFVTLSLCIKIYKFSMEDWKIIFPYLLAMGFSCILIPARYT